jgi:hypothetical protein
VPNAPVPPSGSVPTPSGWRAPQLVHAIFAERRRSAVGPRQADAPELKVVGWGMPRVIVVVVLVRRREHLAYGYEILEVNLEDLEHTSGKRQEH